jgi:glutamate dehydrogenase
MNRVVDLLDHTDVRSYRDALLTKKLAAMALYQHAADWADLTRRLEADLLGTLAATAATAGG